LVLTTHAAAQASVDSDVLGVVRDWHVTELWPLVRSIHATNADILHIQHAAGTYGFDRSIFLLPLLLRLTRWRSPIVTTVHEYGWWEWQPSGIPKGLLEWLKEWGQTRRWWDREDGFLLTQSNAIITTNRDAKQTIEARLPYLSDRLYQIPIGANVEVSSPAGESLTQVRHQIRQSCSWDDDVAIAAFFGFLHPVKGLETLLPAFKQVVEAIPNARLVLVGGVESLALPGEQAANYWHKLQTLIADLSLENQVHMTGYLENNAVSHYLLTADVGVLPFNHGVTLKSGSLLALMAHHLPVIATRSTPPDPALEDDQLLRWVTPRDIEGLASELIRLFSNAEARHQLSQAGDRFSRQFSWPDIAQKHHDIYQALLSAPSRRATR
jgi:glycosyltransferase involved in cell wall biosynthesis